MELAFMNITEKDPYTLSTVIADCAEVQHRTVQRLIRNNLTSLNKFGKVRFEITPSESGQNLKVYRLNEQQATLLITFMRNTDKVIQFKENLVKAFFDLRTEITQIKLQRELEKPLRRELTDAIKAWPHVNQWSYKQITDLMFKAITGQNAKQLKEAHQTTRPALDLLTSGQLADYYKLESQVISLLELGLDYQTIKVILSKRKQAHQ